MARSSGQALIPQKAAQQEWWIATVASVNYAVRRD